MRGASVHALAEGQQDRRLHFGSHPLSVSLRPRLIRRDTWDRAVLAAEAVYGALQTLESALLRDPYLRAELDLSPEEEVLALADPGYAASSPSSRLDSFFADDIGYVEYNAESPAGMAYGDELMGVFDALPVMAEVGKRYALTGLPVRQHQLDVMLSVFREWAANTGHSDPPALPSSTGRACRRSPNSRCSSGSSIAAGSPAASVSRRRSPSTARRCGRATTSRSTSSTAGSSPARCWPGLRRPRTCARHTSPARCASSTATEPSCCTRR